MDFLNIFTESENDIKVAAECNTKKFPFKDSSSINNKPTEKKKKIPKTCSMYFSSKNAIIYQNFSFRSTIIQYILENQSLNVQRKLQKCCKYFFIKDPTLICERIATNYSKSPFRFHHKTAVFGLSYFSLLPNFYNISIESSLKFDIGENKLALSHLISNNIKKCTAKSVNIENQDLTFNELKLLIGFGSANELILESVNIFDGDKNEMVQLAEILKLVSNLKILKLTGFEITSSTFKPLANFSFNEKLNYLYIYNISNVDSFNPTYLIQFLMNNISTKSEVKIFLKSDLEWEEIGEAMTICKTRILTGVNSHFADEKEKPQLSIDLYYN